MMQRGYDRYAKAWMVRAYPGAPELGPVSLDQIERGLAEGNVTPDNQMAQQGSAEWFQVRHFFANAQPSVTVSDPSASLGSHPSSSHRAVPNSARRDRKRSWVVAAAATVFSLAAVCGVAYGLYRYSRPGKGLPVVAEKLPPNTSYVAETRLRSDLDELVTLPPEYATSSLAALACGGPDIALNLALAINKDIASLKRLGIFDLTNPDPIRKSLRCGDAVRQALVTPSVVTISFRDGNESHEVRVLRARLEELPIEAGFVRHNFSGLAGYCLRGAEAKADCEDTALAAFRDGELWAFGRVPAIESFARSYTTARTELSTNLDILQATIAATESADFVAAEARPETIPWRMICDLPAPLEHENEFFEACFPRSQERLLAQIDAKVRGLAIERDLLAHATTMGVTFVLLARDEATARELEADLLDLARDWRAQLTNGEAQLVKLMRAPSNYVHDKLWASVFDAYLRALKGMSVQRSGEVVRLVIREPFRDAEVKGLREFVETRTQEQLATIAIVDALLQGAAVPSRSLAVFTGPEIATWITAPRASASDCQALRAKMDALTPADVPPELFGVKFDLERRLAEDACVGAAFPEDSRVCFDNATSLEALGACRLPDSPFVMAAMRRLEGQWAVAEVYPTERASSRTERVLRTIKLEFAGGRIAFSVLGMRPHVGDAEIASDDVDRASFKLWLDDEFTRKTIRFVDDDTILVPDLSADAAVTLKRAKFDSLFGVTQTSWK